MPLHPTNRPLTKSPQKIHNRADAICRDLLYSVNYLRLTSVTLPTSDKEHAYPTNQTLKMNLSLLFVTYNSAPVPKGNKYVANTQAELGALASATGSHRCRALPREEEWLRGSGAFVFVQAVEGRLPGRDGSHHPALRAGMAGRTARLTVHTTTATTHFDANAGALNHAFGAPVLLSGFRKEEGDVASGLRDAAIAQARQSPSQEQQQAEQVTRR